MTIYESGDALVVRAEAHSRHSESSFGQGLSDATRIPLSTPGYGSSPIGGHSKRPGLQPCAEPHQRQRVHWATRTANEVTSQSQGVRKHSQGHQDLSTLPP